MRFRLGSWLLHCHNHSISERSRRVCVCCDMDVVEDELHVAFECPFYDDIRCDFPDLPFHESHDMNMFFGTSTDQRDLVDFVFAIYMRRFRKQNSESGSGH